MRLLRFNESDVVFPDIKVLQLMYGNELPDASPHTLRMRYMADVKSGKVQRPASKEPEMSLTEMDKINDIKTDVAFKVSEILGTTLLKKDNGFLDKINALIKEYEHLIPKVTPGTKVIDIDEPFKDKNGNIRKFRDPVAEEPSIVPKGIVGDTIGGISSGLGSMATIS
jgi:hypothetical protein